MKLCFIILSLAFSAGCRRESHCENATVHLSKQCGVDWEVEFEGASYPVQNLPDALKRDKNRIEILQHHFYDDPRLCACCGFRYLVVDDATDEAICL